MKRAAKKKKAPRKKAARKTPPKTAKKKGKAPKKAGASLRRHEPPARRRGTPDVSVAATRSMRPGTLWVDSTDLEQWAERLEAQAVMPELMRRLVRATIANPKRVEFAAGEAVLLAGWDGIVETELGRERVPAGHSRWELGAKANVKRKADEDYEKRKAEPGDGVDPSRTTFVFVTPRRWSGKAAWLEKRRREGLWAEVRAYDAVDLEQWLEENPAVAAWLAHRIGKMLPGVASLSDAWDRWSIATSPPTPAALVLARRRDVSPSVRAWLAGRPACLIVQGETEDEAVAFLAATVLSSQESERDRALARTITVEDPTSWELLSSGRNPLILVNRSGAIGAALAVRAGHHVFIPVGRGQTLGGDALRLGSLDLTAVITVLEGEGFDHDEARRLARQSGGSVVTLRRQLQAPETVLQPAWADGPELLVPLVLLDGWSESDADKEVVAELTGRAYDDVDLLLTTLVQRPDAPITRTGGSWRWVSREDAWRFLAPRLSPTILKRWEKVSIDVLGEVDPATDLASDERWLAQIHGKVATHSYGLREGLCRTLALLACHPSSSEINDGVVPADRAQVIVRKLLKGKPWKTWATLSNELCTLAEAAPDLFLECVDDRLRADPGALFDDGVVGEDPLDGVRWALEVLAASPDHLTLAVTFLGRLGELIPPPKANPPLRSLREIFVVWHPQTGTDLAGRISALKRVCSVATATGWTLLKELMPAIGGDTATYTRRPRWRAWPVQMSVTNGDIARGLNAIADEFVRAAGGSAARWCDLLEELSTMPGPAVRRALDDLQDRVSRGSFDAPSAAVLWTKLRETLCSHRSFGGAPWSLPAELLAELERIYDALRPADEVLAMAWLFDMNPKLPSGEAEEWEQHQQQILVARQAALQRVLELRPATVLVEIATQVEASYQLGGSAVWVALGPDGPGLLGLALLDPRDAVQQFAIGLAGTAFSQAGWPWVERCRATFTPEQAGILALALPFGRRVWDWLNGIGPEATQAYWSRIGSRRLESPQDVKLACRALIDAGRPYAAIQVAASVLPRERATVKTPAPLSAGVVLEALRTALPRDPREERPTRPMGRLGHQLCELLRFLYDDATTPDGELVQLEWALLPLIINEQRSPRRLHEALGTDTGFFATVIEFVYRARSESEQPEEEPSAEQVNRAQAARELLKSWETLPGQRPDGQIDAAELKRWVEAARGACAARDRAWVGDYHVGEILACAPMTEEPWPPLAVREVIEEVASETVEEGFYIGVVNRRGTSLRAHGAGGEQERQLASRFRGWAEALRIEWPRTARELRRVVESYERDARREDQCADLMARMA